MWFVVDGGIAMPATWLRMYNRCHGCGHWRRKLYGWRLLRKYANEGTIHPVDMYYCDRCIFYLLWRETFDAKEYEELRKYG